MVRSCKIISERLTGIFSDENSSGITDLCHHLKRIRCHDLKMFGSNRICCIDCILHCLCNENMSIIIKGFLNDLASGKLFYKCICLCRYFLCKFHTCCNQNCRCHLVMLCLRQKICCHETWICRLISKNKDLTWSCD